MKRRKRSKHRLDAGVRGWIVKTASRNLWRVHSWYNLDDLVQEGLLCYAICAYKYKHAENMQQMMRLVQTVFRNHITDLANSRTEGLQEIVMDSDSPVFLNQVEWNEGVVLTLINQLPQDLQDLLRMLLDQNQHKPRMKLYRDGTRENTNEYLCRLLNVDPNLVDIVEVFKEHFKGRITESV